MLREMQSYFDAFVRSKSTPATIARSSAGILMVKIAGVGLTFSAHMLWARFMGIESYGIYILALAWMNVLLLASRFGFDVSSVRFVAVYSSRGDWGLLRGFLRFSRRLVLSGGVLAAFLLALGVWLFGLNVSAEMLHTFWLASVILPFFALFQISEASLRGLKRVVLSLIPSAILHPLVLIISLLVTILVFGGSPRGTNVMGLYLLATIIALGTLIYFFSRSLPQQVRRADPVALRREWFLASCSMMLVTSFFMVLNQTNIIMIGLLKGAAEVGLFGAAIRIANLLQLTVVSVNAALAPYAADLFAKGELERLRRTVKISVRTVFVANLLASVLIMAAGKWILGFLGSEFVSAYKVLLILLLGQLLYAAVFPAGMLLNMTGYERDSARVLGISALVNIALCSIFIRLMGVTGAAVATVTVTLFWGGGMAFLVRKRINITLLSGP